MHIISLIIAYAATLYALWLLLKVSKQCTTTPQADSPVKTEPSPTGPTHPISLSRSYAMNEKLWDSARELQEDTEFRSQSRQEYGSTQSATEDKP